MPEEITALIVDDHEVVREGLRLSLSRAPHIRIVGEAADGAAAVELSLRRKPDVVIMDVRMPGMDGLEATKLLLKQEPWLGLTGFVVLAVMLTLLIFVGEAVRDAFDPRKVR